jgi:hypothetical protein
MKMTWTKSFDVTLRINSGFRIGAGESSLEVSLPLVKKIECGANLVSSFRGVLRKSVKKMIASTKLSKLSGVEENLFGSWISKRGEETTEGKLHFQLVDFKPGKKISRTGIRMDNKFNSVQAQALFIYESIEGGDTGNILTFKITPLFPLTEEEVAVLLAGLNGLYYDNIGGFASRGMGIIDSLKVSKEFTNYAMPILKRKLEGVEK